MSARSDRRTVRIGIVGAGTIARIHVPNLAQIEGASVAAICDLDEGRARALAADHGARTYDDAARMVDEAELDAVFVCTPPLAHGDIVERAARRGLHVYVEKPVARDLDSALRTAAVVEEAGVISSVGYMWRYAPVVDRARTLFDPSGGAMLLGRLLNGPNAPGWSQDRDQSGGILVEFATHVADLLRYLGGEVELVHGVGTEVVPGPPARGPDSVAVALRYASGVIGSLEATWALAGSIWDVQVIAPGVNLRLDLARERLRGIARDEPIDEASPIPAGVEPHGFSGGPSWYLSARAFVEAVRSEAPELVRASYREGVRTLAFTLAADEAVRTGRPVAVPRV